MINKRHLGWDGEYIARKFLEDNGFRFLESNFYTRWGEIDLIMKDKDYLVFVEVKSYRTSFINARDVINRKKKRHLRLSGDWYRVKYNYDSNYRYDLCICDGKRVVDYISAIEIV